MLYALYAFLIGAASAFSFEPVGLWPILPVAFAVLCEFICRQKNIWRALRIGWAFGVGQFVVGLNWIATAFTFQSNMASSVPSPSSTGSRPRWAISATGISRISGYGAGTGWRCCSAYLTGR